ncbi:geranylgeranyl reductase family protein [Actinoplanes sp. TBRC 11911]|uniref:geranylgeranyl reductase family protein n=1 Tax=Actinoplanes sp. TBRC 11911 TaxID=2729386 RepID=UPI00145DB643|nr:geranylgeranyl reductase family protein [Actinoplanes sp. TBRC 11911]NMO53789.1 geranylgeranyl reductase family protein [Actinoplanes sp. TBRC 11911]
MKDEADVIVVGAGPGGSAAAYHLARHGLRVLLLEKTRFPREKVCGDGLTPRGVRQLVRMGVDTSEEAGWVHLKGLRVNGGGVRLELDWPELASFAGYGLARTRVDFDDLLARRAVEAGAILHTGVHVTGPVLDEGRAAGVTAMRGDEPVEFRAPLVIAADGVSGKLPLAMGLAKRDDRPLGVAVRRYYTSPVRADDHYMESWLDLHGAQDPKRLLPGYSWCWSVGDGRVNVGLGILNSSAAFGKTNYRALLTDWLTTTPAEWGMRDETNAEGPILGAALPMGFNRVPHYTRGLMLVGDSGGMVNPMNGEGIAYAMESGELAAEVAAGALARPAGPDREQALRAYPAEMSRRFGGYYRLGGVFVKLIGNPHIMRLATQHGLPHPTLMRFVLKLLANLTDPHDGDAMDRIINGLSKVAPSV